MPSFPQQLARIRHIAHARYLREPDRQALLAVLAVLGRLIHVLKRYLVANGGASPDLADVDLEAAQLLREIEGRS